MDFTINDEKSSCLSTRDFFLVVVFSFFSSCSSLSRTVIRVFTLMYLLSDDLSLSLSPFVLFKTVSDEENKYTFDRSWLFQRYKIHIISRRHTN